MHALKVSVILVVVIGLLGIPSHAQFQDDPGVDTCLGPEDPFCPPPQGGGGGGGVVNTSTCYKCRVGVDPTETSTITWCDLASSNETGGTGCTAYTDPLGFQRCDLSGSWCTISG